MSSDLKKLTVSSIGKKIHMTMTFSLRLRALYGLYSRTNFTGHHGRRRLLGKKHATETHIRQRRIKTYHHQIANFRNPTTKTRRYRTDDQISKCVCGYWPVRQAMFVSNWKVLMTTYSFIFKCLKWNFSWSVETYAYAICSTKIFLADQKNIWLAKTFWT